jgi:hypothetical protein
LVAEEATGIGARDDQGNSGRSGLGHGTPTWIFSTYSLRQHLETFPDALAAHSPQPSVPYLKQRSGLTQLGDEDGAFDAARPSWRRFHPRAVRATKDCIPTIEVLIVIIRESRLEPRQHPPHLRNRPPAAAGRAGDATLVKRVRDAIQRRYAGRPYRRDYRGTRFGLLTTGVYTGRADLAPRSPSQHRP